MLTSVTHVSWVFHSVDGTTDDWYNWILPVSCAVGIDAAVGTISLFLTTQKDWSKKTFGYTFMGLLVLLSWFANWLFAKQFMPVSGVWIKSVLGMKISWLAPIVYGSLPVLVFAFALIIELLMSERLTATELEEMLKEKSSLEEVRNKYKQEPKVRKVFGTLKEIKNEALTLFTPEPTSEPTSEPEQEPTTDPELETVESNIVQFETSTEQTRVFPSLKQKVLNLIHSEPGITNSEIIRRTGISKSYLSGIRAELEELEREEVS
jgi:hypothetical protein